MRRGDRAPPLGFLHAADTPAVKLVIVKAVDGDPPDAAKADVTAEVAAMVKDDALFVVGELGGGAASKAPRNSRNGREIFASVRRRDCDVSDLSLITYG